MQKDLSAGMRVKLPNGDISDIQSVLHGGDRIAVCFYPLPDTTAPYSIRLFPDDLVEIT
jgi:hypothetical protein